MKIEIDQSGKVEDTSKISVIGDSIGNNVWITQNDKRFIQHVFREMGKPQMYMIRSFAALTSILISLSVKDNHTFRIDIEYPGRDAEIKAFIVMYLEKMGLKIDAQRISFSTIGKKSKAHYYAYRVFKDANRPQNTHISLEKMLKIML
jgi:hypothetical protein